MVLYKKVFPLGKGISFFQYITALRKAYFPNFVLAIDKIPSTENYQAQIFFTAPLWKWGLANAFLGGVFLNKCKIQYFNDEEYFILQASAGTGNLFFVSIQFLSAILFFVFAIFMTVTNGDMSLNNIFGFVIIITIMLVPSSLIYLRDKNFWDKVGSLGTELEKN
jgi:hypothetical protein